MAQPAVALQPGAGGVRLACPERLDLEVVAASWGPAFRALRPGAALTLDVGRLVELDTSGAVFLLKLEQAAGRASWQGLAEGPVKTMLDRTRRGLAQPVPAAPAEEQPVIRLGRAVVEAGRGALQRVAFLGGIIIGGLDQLRQPGRARVRETLRHLDEAGLRAFGLTALLGVLIGIILAFQSSIPMRQFGAEIFIPNLVGISLLRELGPLMAAVILAGRTGSAYAAELGTMTVNEEVDALTIMGISPVAWLVLPRILAALLVMPVLALLLDLAGLVGMGGVMSSLGYPPVAVVNQLQNAIKLRDLLGGLFKAAVFGFTIGLVGCRAGLAAGRGPRAVGDAATSAVVAGIVSIVVLDGIFAVLFYRLGW